MDVFKCVEKNYKENFEQLEDKRFHFASRMFLWSKDEFWKNTLSDLKKIYIGDNELEYSTKISSILSEKISYESLLFREQREQYFLKYPNLKKFNKILFRHLFSKTIYNVDLGEIIAQQIDKKDLIELRDKLWNDKSAIAALSTHAINYFYTLDFYLNDKNFSLNPAHFLEIVENENIFKNQETVVLQVYLLTHCIIGGSLFYAKYANSHAGNFEKILEKLEEILSRDYEVITLDNKVEFLVCAKLCKKNSFLEAKILQDVEESFDAERNIFLEKGKIKGGNSFKSGEHRNVLALMAFYLQEKIEK